MLGWDYKCYIVSELIITIFIFMGISDTIYKKCNFKLGLFQNHNFWITHGLDHFDNLSILQSCFCQTPTKSKVKSPGVDFIFTPVTIRMTTPSKKGTCRYNVWGTKTSSPLIHHPSPFVRPLHLIFQSYRRSRSLTLMKLFLYISH